MTTVGTLENKAESAQKIERAGAGSKRMSGTWPECVMLLRHGQSAGNVALEKALAADASVIDIAERDVDVPLSDLGRRQARAFGEWLAQQPENVKPTLVLTSPYVRAFETAKIVVDALETDESKPWLEVIIDERLREREFGIVDRLTKKGIVEKYPDQAELHSRLKKFYYRAPGGESWCDVILRLRSVQDSLARDYANERVLIVCHTVVIYCFRYLFEKLTEKELLTIDSETNVANCSLTTYRFAHEAREPKLETFNFVAPLKDAGEKVTRNDDAKIAPR